MAKEGMFRTKIFIVDDEADARKAISHMLRSKGYEVLEASSGQEVLERAKAEWPGLIILDVILPDLPGTEVLERLRADPITKAIPVLLLTAKPSVVRQLPQYREKQDRILEKPERVEDLLRAIQEMLAGRGAR